ncbi:MAG: flagellar protein FlgN [bacterium]|jgi:hypothetical protein|nr:flagellar protein FlgN [bacterium]
MINQLIDIISKEAVLFESFLELLQRQKEMLVANDLEGLQQVTERQHEKLTESRILNKQREALVEEIKAARSIDGDLTVSRLLDLVDQNQAERLRQLRELILELNNKINDSRNTNAMLLNQSREFVAKTMAMLSRMNNPEPTYGSKRSETDPARPVAMDRRA